MKRAHFAVWVGYGDDVTDEIVIHSASDEIEAAEQAAGILLCEYGVGWLIIMVMPYRIAHVHSRSR